MAAEINITGIIKLKIPVTTGITKSGKQYTKGGFVLQLLDQYSTTVYFDVFGNVADMLNAYPVNGHVTVIGHVTSRDYQGKYYTNVIADSILPQIQGGYTYQQPHSHQPSQPQQYQQPMQYQQPYHPPQPQQLSPSMQQAQQTLEQAGFEQVSEQDLPF